MNRPTLAFALAIGLSGPSHAQNIQEVRSDYLRTCIEQERTAGRDAPYSYCSCSFSAIADNLTLSEYENLEQRFKDRRAGQETPPQLAKIRPAMVQCNARFTKSPQ